MSRWERKAMIRRGHPDLSFGRQCRLLSISRSWFYYAPMGASGGGTCRWKVAWWRLPVVMWVASLMVMLLSWRAARGLGAFARARRSR